MLLVLCEKAVAFLKCLGLFHVKLGIGMSLLLLNKRQVHFSLNVSFDICKLLRRITRITLVDDLVIVTSLLQLSEIELFVDIVRLLHRELRQSLLEMRMEGSRVYKQLSSQDVFPESVLGNHALNSMLKNMFGSLFKHMLHRDCLKVSNVARVLAIHFLLLLAPCHMLHCRIYHHTVVSMLTRVPCHIVWLMLPSEEVGSESCDTSKGHPCCIEQVPGLSLVLHRTIHRLRIVFGLLVYQCAVS